MGIGHAHRSDQIEGALRCVCMVAIKTTPVVLSVV